MRTSPRRRFIPLGLLALILSSPASVWAHAPIGQATGFSTGFHHPLSGWDHLLVMLAVGIWAAQRRGRLVWMLPLTFVGVMSLGGLVGSMGLPLPGVEAMILLSVIVFTVVIVRRIRFHTGVSVLLVGFFAFFHGFAHGHEMPASASLLSFALGFIVATLFLHGAGILTLRGAMLLVGFFLSGTVAARAASEAEASTPAGESQADEATAAAVVVTGRADDLIGEASSASEGRVGAA